MGYRFLKFAEFFVGDDSEIWIRCQYPKCHISNKKEDMVQTENHQDIDSVKRCEGLLT